MSQQPQTQEAVAATPTAIVGAITFPPPEFVEFRYVQPENLYKEFFTDAEISLDFGDKYKMYFEDFAEAHQLVFNMASLDSQVTVKLMDYWEANLKEFKISKLQLPGVLNEPIRRTIDELCVDSILERFAADHPLFNGRSLPAVLTRQDNYLQMIVPASMEVMELLTTFRNSLMDPQGRAERNIRSIYTHTADNRVTYADGSTMAALTLRLSFTTANIEYYESLRQLVGAIMKMRPMYDFIKSLLPHMMFEKMIRVDGTTTRRWVTVNDLTNYPQFQEGAE